MTDTSFEAAKTVLQNQLAELETRQAHLKRDISEPLNADSSEQAVELEDDESLEKQAQLVAREITLTKNALGRIADGSYGSCRLCGTDINPARLEAQPEAALCIDCASKAASG